MRLSADMAGRHHVPNTAAAMEQASYWQLTPSALLSTLGDTAQPGGCKIRATSGKAWTDSHLPCLLHVCPLCPAQICLHVGGACN